MFDFIRPEFFDIFGLAVFAFIVGVSIWGIRTGRAMPRLALSILLVIGISGFIVDGVIVFLTYF